MPHILLPAITVKPTPSCHLLWPHSTVQSPRQLNISIKWLCRGRIIQVCWLFQTCMTRFLMTLMIILRLAVFALKVRIHWTAFLKGTSQLVFPGLAHIFESAPLISQLIVNHRHHRATVQTGMPWIAQNGIQFTVSQQWQTLTILLYANHYQCIRIKWPYKYITFHCVQALTCIQHVQ